MHTKFFKIFGSQEQRLIWKQSTDDADTRALTETETKKSAREVLQDKITQDPNSAANRLRDIEGKWTRYLHPFSKEKNEAGMEQVMNKTITKLAQERAAEALKKIKYSQSDAERRLLAKSSMAKDSLMILEWKKTICTEALKDYEVEIKEKEAIRQAYLNAMGDVGKLGKKHTDAPALKGIKVKVEMVKRIKNQNDTDIQNAKNDPERQRMEKFHDNVKSLILNLNPQLASRIDTLIKDNAAGVNKDLIDEINKIAIIDKNEKAMLLDMAKQMRLRLLGRKNNAAVREMFQVSITDNVNNNPTTVDARLARLKSRGLGQGVALTMPGKNVTTGVTQMKDENGGQIMLAANSGEKFVINMKDKSLTGRNSSGEFVRGKLDLLTVPDTSDQSKVYFKISAMNRLP